MENTKSSNDLSAAAAATENLSNRLNDIRLTSSEIQFLNRQLIALEKSFIDEKGIMAIGLNQFTPRQIHSLVRVLILPGIEYELALKGQKQRGTIDMLKRLVWLKR